MVHNNPVFKEVSFLYCNFVQSPRTFMVDVGVLIALHLQLGNKFNINVAAARLICGLFILQLVLNLVSTIQFIMIVIDSYKGGVEA